MPLSLLGSCVRVCQHHAVVSYHLLNLRDVLGIVGAQELWQEHRETISLDNKVLYTMCWLLLVRDLGRSFFFFG